MLTTKFVKIEKRLDGSGYDFTFHVECPNCDIDYTVINNDLIEGVDKTHICIWGVSLKEKTKG